MAFDDFDDHAGDEVSLTTMAGRMLIVETMAVAALTFVLDAPNAKASMTIFHLIHEAVQNRCEEAILSADMASMAQRYAQELLGKALETLYPRLH